LLSVPHGALDALQFAGLLPSSTRDHATGWLLGFCVTVAANACVVLLPAVKVADAGASETVGALVPACVIVIVDVADSGC
jgi:hypothetical protein